VRPCGDHEPEQHRHGDAEQGDPNRIDEPADLGGPDPTLRWLVTREPERAQDEARARAQAGAPQLADAIVLSAQRWFGEDAGYPGEWEPSGADFLSPALSEAELMSAILPPQRFASWLDAFLPDIAGHRPAALFTPAVVSDPGDGYIAHLHGLNATRAWCWRRLAEALPEGDLRIGPALTAAKSHAEAALPHVAGDDYMVEHFLACYAVLMLS